MRKALVVLSMMASSLFAQETVPDHLYKILSLDNWHKSEDHVALAEDDAQFIHFSQQDQVERIATKYWADAREYVVLEIDPTKLEGKLVYEANPGGIGKYYHLYDGKIPYEAVVNSKICKKSI